MTDKLQAAREADGIPADPIADNAISKIVGEVFEIDVYLSGGSCQVPVALLKDALLRAYHEGQKRGSVQRHSHVVKILRNRDTRKTTLMCLMHADGEDEDVRELRDRTMAMKQLDDWNKHYEFDYAKAVKDVSEFFDKAKETRQ